MLHDDGSISQKSGRSEFEDLTPIDRGTGTTQIFATGTYLYVLKGDGTVWRISNPRAPDPKSDFTRLEFSSPTGGDYQFVEIFVVEQGSQEDGQPAVHDIYLYTNDNLLLKGTDMGGQQVELRQQYAAAARELTSE